VTAGHSRLGRNSWRVGLSRPCGKEKSQGRGTEYPCQSWEGSP
jgi:hypothetical protein